MVSGIARTLADEEEALAQQAREAQTVPMGPPLADELRAQLVTVLLGAAETLRLSGQIVSAEDADAPDQPLIDELLATRTAAATEARALIRAARAKNYPHGSG